MAAGNADDEAAALLKRQKAALSYLGTTDDGEGSDRSLQRRARIGKAQDALSALPGFWPAALRLADLHEEAGSPKKAVKPLEAAFRNMPHEALATRLQALWGVNEGTAAARLMRLIPSDDGALAAEGGGWLRRSRSRTGSSGKRAVFWTRSGRRCATRRPGGWWQGSPPRATSRTAGPRQTR